jgi:hypothetical protein
MIKNSPTRKNSIKKPFETNVFFNSFLDRILNLVSQNWPDVLIIFVLATAMSIAVYLGSQQIHPVFLSSVKYSDGDQFGDIWFEGDLPRVFSNMTDRVSNHFRTQVHPLFSITAYPIVFIVTKIFGLAPIMAVRVVMSAVASLWLTALFILLRLIGCLRLDAALFSILSTTSAAAMCWFIVPETYSFGSLTILIALCFAAITEYYQFSSLWYVGASALTLSMTTTNWMTGILIAIINFPRKKALQVTVNAFSMVVLLWSVQKFLFASAVFFLGERGEKKFIFRSDSGGPLNVLKSFVSHTMIMPSINVINDRYQPPHVPVLSTQFAAPGSGSLWGMVAVVLWTALLGLGIWGFFSYKQHLKLRIVIALTMLGHLLLHCIYGEETFLYSLHFLPVLIILAAFSVFTRARIVALFITTLLILTVGVNNYGQLNKALNLVEQQVPKNVQQSFPNIPRSVVFTVPESQAVPRAYSESI